MVHNISHVQGGTWKQMERAFSVRHNAKWADIYHKQDLHKGLPKVNLILREPNLWHSSH